MSCQRGPIHAPKIPIGISSSEWVDISKTNKQKQQQKKNPFLHQSRIKTYTSQFNFNVILCYIYTYQYEVFATMVSLLPCLIEQQHDIVIGHEEILLMVVYL